MALIAPSHRTNEFTWEGRTFKKNYVENCKCPREKKICYKYYLFCCQRVQLWAEHISVSNDDNFNYADYVLQSFSLGNTGAFSPLRNIGTTPQHPMREDFKVAS